MGHEYQITDIQKEYESGSMTTKPLIIKPASTLPIIRLKNKYSFFKKKKKKK
jgi:hypothetical protein